MGDVGERAAVHEGRGALQRLHEVRLQGVLQKRGHGALGLQVVGRDRRVIVGVAHHDAAQTLLQVGDGGGQTEDGHDLAGHGDVEAVLAGHTVGLAAEAVHDVAQLAVVHVHHALPGDLADIDVQLVAVLDMGVQQSREQVVGSPDGVEVAGEVQVDVLHGHHLGVPAAGSAALDAEHGPERRLAQGHDHVLAALGQGIGEPDGGGGLALAGGRGVDGGHQDELARGVLLVAQEVEIHLGLVVAVQLKVLLVDAGNGGDLANGFRFGRLGNFNVGQHVGPSFSCRGAGNVLAASLDECARTLRAHPHSSHGTARWPAPFPQGHNFPAIRPCAGSKAGRDRSRDAFRAGIGAGGPRQDDSARPSRRRSGAVPVPAVPEPPYWARSAMRRRPWRVSSGFTAEMVAEWGATTAAPGPRWR